MRDFLLGFLVLLLFYVSYRRAPSGPIPFSAGLAYMMEQWPSPRRPQSEDGASSLQVISVALAIVGAARCSWNGWTSCPEKEAAMGSGIPYRDGQTFGR
jgi:hypothetical protein